MESTGGRRPGVTFPFGGPSQQAELTKLIVALRDKIKRYPSTSLQVRRAVCWNSKALDSVTYGILVLKHLNDLNKDRVAHFLTMCHIDFFFSRAHVLAMRLDGVSSNTLLRFVQYAEVPIPACPSQGAFQITFYPKGASSLLNKCTIGRIGSFDPIPAQVQIEAHCIDDPDVDTGELTRFLGRKIDATCFQQVLCRSEQSGSAVCLQFLIPNRFESKLPACLDFQGDQIEINHPSPFVNPISVTKRPPEEQSKFEHWKEAAYHSFLHRKRRRNSLTHFPKLGDSMLRFNLFRHAEVLSKGKSFPAMYEIDFFPVLFIDGFPEIDDVVENCFRRFTDSKSVGSLFKFDMLQKACPSLADIHLDTDTLRILEIFTR